MNAYERRVRELEEEGLTRSDAQGVADAEGLDDIPDWPYQGTVTGSALGSGLGSGDPLTLTPNQPANRAVRARKPSPPMIQQRALL